MTIPDFAVSSQEAGFDEFLKVFNEYFKLSCRGEFLFYGASDGQPQRDDIRWTNKFILPQEAIALLTGKQLTEGDFAHVSEHQSAMEYLQTPSLKEMESQPEIVPVQEEVGAIAVIISDNLNPKLNTNEQAFFIAGFEEAVKYFKLNQQTAHLQQQLKEAKELHNIDLITIRNMFVSMMPTGEVKAWDFVIKIKEFTSWFDNNYLNK